MPRGMIVTLCTGSELGVRPPTIAWPDSWYAVFSFSRCDITTDLRSGPTITRSIASSQSFISMTDLLRRAASSAASLRRFSRSAPEKPGVRRASVSSETSFASGLFLECTPRIA